MNAAFLLVTTACFAGQTPAPKAELVRPPAGAPAIVAPAAPATAAPGMISSTVIPGGCGSAGCDGGCGSACDSCGGKHKLFGRLGGMFGGGHHKSSCDTCDTCGSSGHGHKVWSAPVATCGCEATCDSCGGKHKLFGRLGGGHGHKASACGCDGGCGTASGCANGGCAPSIVPSGPAPLPGSALPPGGEIINTPPKKMPANPAPPVTPKTSSAAPAQGPAPAAPSIEVVPPSIPAIPSIANEPRSPF